jgi:CMP/dCMP kinase
MLEKTIITIDGPSGVGKSTAAKAVAEKLGLSYLDTGAMYRAIALQAQRERVNIDNLRELESLLKHTEITFTRDQNHILLVLVNNEDITDKIRTPEISRLSSDIATKGIVRKRLIEIQRRVGKEGGIVAEGRDMGTYVFPDTKYKFYLDAELEMRAKRRWNQLHESGSDANIEDISKQIEARDKQDKERSESPLHPARNAVIIDTTHLNADEVVFKIIKEVKDF